MGKKLLTIAVVLIVGFFGFAILSGPAPSNDPPGVRIQKACDAQFGADTEASQSCALALMVKKLDDQQRDKLNRAASAARFGP